MLPGSTADYLYRYLDQIFDDVIDDLRAVALDGAKGVGKTVTASRRVDHVYRLDTPEGLRFFQSDPGPLTRTSERILIDEWQLFPESWNYVRRAVDDHCGGLKLLTGSASPTPGITTHSGAARIISLQMRPLALSERRETEPTVFIRDLFNGNQQISGQTSFEISDYAHMICASGFPGLQGKSPRVQRMEISSYLHRIIDRDIVDMGHVLRKPESLRAWLRSYAAATGTTASYSEILDAATVGTAEKPSRSTVQQYREILTKLWILDPLPAWSTTFSPFNRLKTSPKHYLLDPALSAHLLGVNPDLLVNDIAGGRKCFGHLFEALAVLTVRGAAMAAEADVYHFHTHGKKNAAGISDAHEVDIIIEDYQGRVIACEVKLKPSVAESDLKHLHWLKTKIGDRLIDQIVITTGNQAYRRRDGIAVVPLALLG